MFERKLALALVGSTFFATHLAAAQPLASFEHHVLGAKLQVTPAELYVPKDIPGSLAVRLVTSEGTPSPELARIGHGAHVEAVLRGPAFPAYRLLGLPDEPLVLPPIALTGDYQIDDIRLVNTATGEVLMMASPSRVAVHVFPEVLVSQVESRPLTLDEIQQRGIVIDADTFSAVEFEATFVIEGQTLPVRFPVVTPKFKESTEIIPAAELRERLVEAERINATLTQSLNLPQPMRVPGLNIQIRGLNFQEVGLEEEPPSMPPPIPALIVIPGNIGFLDQFFSVQVFTANAAPSASTISVHSIRAEITLPEGPDHDPQTDDGPLVLARIGPEELTFSELPVRGLGADGTPGTPDDQGRLRPGETGQAEFLVVGKQSGLHAVDIKLSAILDGFAQGEIAIEGRAAGSVMVRNPKFSIAFSHPSTVRDGEPYVASLTILNTSETNAELVSVNLHGASLSGVSFAPGQTETISLGTIAPGESKTADYNLIAQRTGRVTFTNLTGDDSISGRFDLRAGVDERGVALDQNTIGYPEWVSALPHDLRRAADRVLGQALSVSTAAILPAGVRKIAPGIVQARVIELAEAGQRLRYEDTPERVYLDLLLDWHGGRLESLGFDQILRETNAGAAFAGALIAALESGSTSSGDSWVETRARDLAGRGESWGIAASSASSIAPEVVINGAAAPLQLTESGAYSGSGGHLVVVRTPYSRDTAPQITFRVSPATPGGTASWSAFDGEGAGTRFEFEVASDPTLPVCYHFFPIENRTSAAIDVGCTSSSIGEQPVTETAITELPPEIMSATQDLEPIVGRPYPPCGGPSFERNGPPPRVYGNYGTVVAVLFSKPMSAASMPNQGAFVLDNGVGTSGVSLQPGGRVALLNLRHGIGTRLPDRVLTAIGVTDRRGASLVDPTLEIETLADQGVSLRGRVYGTDGAPVAGIPVTLTMHDMISTDEGCLGVDVRAAQLRTDDEGRFFFEYVMIGTLGYTVATTDTRGLDPAAIEFLLEASPEGALDPDELERLAEAGAVEAFTALFRPGDLQGSIAVAEGVDRATFRDQVPLDSPRIGSEVPIALRFRGRGIVEGTVYLSDGVTPVAEAAVNLFPDTGSREKGRGVFTNAGGEFRFFGVPLGSFTVDARTSDGLVRIVAGRLDEPGATVRADIVLSEIEVPKGRLEGTVYEADGITPHAGATVGLLTVPYGHTFAVTTAGADGSFALDDIPAASYRTAAISFDGRRSGSGGIVAVQADVVTYTSIVLRGTARVAGRVELDNGQPASFATVAGGEALVIAGEDGSFELTGVPIGRAVLSAGIEANPSRGIDFTRIGSTSIDVLPGLNYAVIRLEPRGRIRGTVRDEDGNAIPNVRVAIPAGLGFFWTNANVLGEYSFDNIHLGEYLIAAPAPPVHNLDEAVEALEQARTEDEILAALDQINNVFASAAASEYNPAGYGFTRTRLTFDGQTAVADIRYLRRGVISGEVRNDNDVPISASVELQGLKPRNDGSPSFGVVGEMMSDPSTGAFSFANTIGRFTVSAESPFFTQVATHSGETTLTEPDATGIVLRLSTQATHGGLSGTITRDGAPVGAGVRVRVSFSDYEIQTDANGRFVTQVEFPANTYEVSALDPSTGREGFATVAIRAGAVTDVTIPLLAADGALDLTVLHTGGTPASNAQVTIRRGALPARPAYQLTADEDGHLTLSNLIEGPHSITACRMIAQTRLCSSRSFVVRPATIESVVITLEPSGTIAGTYVEADGTTPVAFANVAIGNVAYAATDAAGEFSIEGIPLGVHFIIARNAVTGRAAVGEANLTTPDQVVTITLREDTLGEVVGLVIGGDGASVVPGANVTLTPASSLFQPMTVSTDPVGRFSFPGVPPGTFWLRATAINSHTGSAQGSMPEAGGTIAIDVYLEPRANLNVLVLEPNGAPANALVLASFVGIETSSIGIARFTGLQLGAHTVQARSQVPQETRSTAMAIVPLEAAGESVPATLRLSGVGSVDVLLRDHQQNPVSGGEVTLEMQDAFLGPVSDLGLTGTDGRIRFENVALGEVRAWGQLGALAAAETASISVAGQELDLVLQLGPSATVHGTLVRADGVTPVTSAEVRIVYEAPSGAAGLARMRTNGSGGFSFSGIPEGDFLLEGSVSRYDGVLYYPSEIPTGVTDLALGNVALDEESPQIIEVIPAEGATGVPVDAPLEVTFSEPMDPIFDDHEAVYLTDGISRTPLLLSWPANGAGEHRTLVIMPEDPLASETHYTLVVAAGELLDIDGDVLGHGPVDLAQRSIPGSLITEFTTADSIPPTFEPFTPLDGAEQISVDAAVRIIFSEAMAPSSIVLQVSGPGGPVSGTISTLFDDHVVVFTPHAALSPNAIYSATLSAATDRAGNLALGLPSTHAFATIDTIGPTIDELVEADGRALVAGASIVWRAVLATVEPGVQVQVTPDLSTFYWSPLNSALVPYTLGAAGSLLLRARAIDRFGNYGPWFEDTFTIETNQGPSAAIALITPSTGLLSGRPYVVRVTGVDDSAIARITGQIGGAFVSSQSNQGSATLDLTGTVPATIGPGQSAIINAEVEDNSGLTAAASPLTLPIADGAGPDLTLVGPTETINTGSTVSFTATALDPFGVRELSFRLMGAIVYQTAETFSPTQTSVTRVFQFDVPANATGGDQVLVEVIARDADHNWTPELIDLRIEDVTPPTRFSYAPGNGATEVELSPTISVYFSEPVYGVDASSFYLTENGAPIAGTVTHTPGEQDATLEPAADLLPGTTYQIHLTSAVHDGALNAYVEEPWSFDTLSVGNGPRLTSLVPDDGAVNVAPDRRIIYTFNEPLAPATIDASTLVLEPAAGGPEITTNYFAPGSDFPTDYTFIPPAMAMRPGTTYRLRLLGTPTDSLGDPIVNPSGYPFAEYVTEYQTATVDISVPGGDRLIEGVSTPLSLASASQPAIYQARYRIDGVDLTVNPTSVNQTFTVPLLAGRPTSTIAIGADAWAGGSGFEVEDQIFFIEPAGGDFDGDGLTNSLEASIGTNPFVDDADQDLDGDGLTNGEEAALGTMPNYRDTDRDGFDDGEDPQPLVADRPIGLGYERSTDRHLRFTGSFFFRPTLHFPAGARIPAPMSFELWARPDAVSSTIIESGFNQGFRIEWNQSTGRFVFSIYTSAGSLNLPSAFISTSASWHHLAITYDGARVVCWVDGLIAADAPLSGSLNYNVGEGSLVGFGYLGYLDEIRLWNIALDGPAIRAGLHRVLSGTEPGLHAYWRLDDGNTTTVLDSTQDGTPLNATAANPVSGRNVLPPVYHAGLIEMTASQQRLPLRAYAFDNPPLSIRVTQLNDHGELFTASSRELTSNVWLTTLNAPLTTAPATLSGTTPELLYITDPDYSGPDQLSIVAVAGTRSTTVAIEIDTLQFRDWTGLDSTAPDSWWAPANWSPQGFPSGRDHVRIPDGTSTAIRITSPYPPGVGVAAAGALSLGTGSTISNESGLWVSGHVSSEGTFLTSNPLIFGTGSNIQGTFSSLALGVFNIFPGVVRLGGDLDVTGALAIGYSPPFPIFYGSGLDIGAHSALVTGDLNAYGFFDTGLRMNHPSSLLNVRGNAVFGCNGVSGHLVAQGTLRIGGNFTSNTGDCFSGEPAHRTIFDGGGATQNITITTPASTTFGTLEVAAAANVSLSSNVNVAGDLWVNGTLIVPSGRTLEIFGDLHVPAGGVLNIAGAVTVHGSCDTASGTITGSVSCL